MGESILTRASGTAEAIVPIIPGYHVVMVTLKDSTGSPIPGMRVNCKDGTQYFDYLTNDKGKTMFSTNSGSINLYAPTVFPNNTVIMDHKPTYKNMIDCPVGLSSSVELKMQGYNDGENIRFTRAGNANLYGDCMYSRPPYFAGSTYIFLSTSKVDLSVGGGGGGGGSGTVDKSTYGGGSGGELKTQYGIRINKGYSYSGWIGGGGAGGITRDVGSNIAVSGSSGESSVFLGLSSSGGSGGGPDVSVSPNGGYFGNGGPYGWIQGSTGSMKYRNSNVAYGGGGGCYTGFKWNPDYNAIARDPAARANSFYFGGYPYGGHGAGQLVGDTQYMHAENGGDGGGGGGGGGYYASDASAPSWATDYFWGARGGSGRIELKLYR